jgi:hypothetical protein
MKFKDRDYYRAQSNAELREEAKRGTNVDWHELAIVLEERLYAKETTVSDGCDCRCGRCDCC